MNIALIFKLLGMVSLFKDVTKEVQEAGKESRPWYMQRSVWGAIVAAVSGIAATFLGVTLDAAQLDKITDSIPQLITVGTTLWGAVLMVYGLIAKASKAAKA